MQAQAHETLGQYLRRLRQARGLTGQAVVEAAGIANSTLTFYEQDKSLPTLVLLERVLNILDGDLNYAWALYLIRAGVKQITVPVPQDGLSLQRPLAESCIEEPA